MSITSAESIALDARERWALTHLHPALEEARARNRPVEVALFSSLDARELVQLAVRLCKHEAANVAVIASPTGAGVMFAPL